MTKAQEKKIRALHSKLSDALEALDGSEPKTPAKPKTKTPAQRKVSNPDAQATPAQLASIVRRVCYAADGTTFGERITMGAVEEIFETYPLPPR